MPADVGREVTVHPFSVVVVAGADPFVAPSVGASAAGSSGVVGSPPCVTTSR